MADHPNVERLRRGYEAYARGDLATLRGMFADTITLHFLGHTQLSGAYNGASEVLGYFERLPEIGAAFSFEVHDLLADDEHGVALLAGTAERTGERIHQKVVPEGGPRLPSRRRRPGHRLVELLGGPGSPRRAACVTVPHPLGCRAASRQPAHEAVLDLDGPRPTVELGAIAARSEPGSPSPPCPRCAPSTLHRSQATREVRRSGGTAHERLSARCRPASASGVASESGPRG
jgi:ketosteroid isomerase-like protein